MTTNTRLRLSNILAASFLSTLSSTALVECIFKSFIMRHVEHLYSETVRGILAFVSQVAHTTTSSSLSSYLRGVAEFIAGLESESFDARFFFLLEPPSKAGIALLKDRVRGLNCPTLALVEEFAACRFDNPSGRFRVLLESGGDLADPDAWLPAFDAEVFGSRRLVHKGILVRKDSVVTSSASPHPFVVFWRV